MARSRMTENITPPGNVFHSFNTGSVLKIWKLEIYCRFECDIETGINCSSCSMDVPRRLQRQRTVHRSGCRMRYIDDVSFHILKVPALRADEGI